MRFLFSPHRNSSPQYRYVDMSQYRQAAKMSQYKLSADIAQYRPIVDMSLYQTMRTPPSAMSRSDSFIDQHPEYLTFLRDRDSAVKFHMKYVGPVSLSIYKSHWSP